ncbi:hypothetical protein ACFLTS_04540 [Chloroflexota bacterium]
MSRERVALSLLNNPYSLLEEARKTWDYFISDETVYEGKYINTDSVEDISWVDNYLIGDIWFECLITWVEKLVTAYIIEVSDDASVITSQPNVSLHSRWCDDPMFVGIREKFEVSEQVKFRPIPSIVWLKTFDFTASPHREKLEVRRHCRPSNRFDMHGEFNKPLFIGDEFHPSLGHTQHSESPSNMIKGVSEVCNDITNDETPRFSIGSGVNVNVDNTDSLKWPLRYGLFPDGMLWIERAPNTPFESADVYIRPLSLKPSAIKRMHGANVVKD